MTEIDRLRAALADAREVADRICEFTDSQMEDGDAARRECKALMERIDALNLAPRYEWQHLPELSALIESTAPPGQTVRAYFATLDGETMEVGRG